MRKILLCFLLVLFCVSHAFAAENTKKTGAVQTILNIPGKLVEPVTKSSTSPVNKKAETVSTSNTDEASAKVAPETGATKPRKSAKDMTRAELITYIKVVVDANENILKAVPELKKSKSAAGIVYAYKDTKLEDLDRSDLEKIFGNVRNQVARIKVEKLSKQMAAVRSGQQAAAGTKSFSVPDVPPTPPRVFNPPPALPRVPRTPKAPPRPPAQLR